MIKINIPKINPYNIIDVCIDPPDNYDLINDVKRGALVIAWDNCKKDETPFYRVGFLESFTFNSSGDRQLRIISTDKDGSFCSIRYDNMAVIPAELCPRVVFHTLDPQRPSIGHLVGVTNIGTDDINKVEFIVAIKDSDGDYTMHQTIAVKHSNLFLLNDEDFGISEKTNNNNTTTIGAC